MIVERHLLTTVARDLTAQPASSVSQESQSDIVVMDMPGQAQHLVYSPLNFFGLCTGIEPKKHEKT